MLYLIRVNVAEGEEIASKPPVKGALQRPQAESTLGSLRLYGNCAVVHGDSYFQSSD